MSEHDVVGLPVENPAPLSRRRLMISGAAIAIAVLLRGEGFSALYANEASKNLHLLPRCLSQFPLNPSKIGLAYLAQNPAEAEKETLTRLVLARLSQSGYAVHLSRYRGLHHAVAACLRDDFASGNTVTIDGWIFSRTEARLCALSA
jgi:hypothetical protein